MSERTI